MSNSGGRIYAPVSVEDVRRVLGEGCTDIGTLCKSKRINKWAKYKPVAFATVITDANTWKGADGKCGLTIPIYNAVGTLSSGLIKAMVDGVSWDYTPPQGGASQPFRLADFNGYYHEAVAPFGTSLPKNIYLDNNGKLILQLENINQSAGGDYNLQLSHFTFNGIASTNMYVGVVLVKGTQYITATSNVKSTDTVSVELENMSGYTGEWKAGFFLSSAYFTQTGSVPSSGTFVPMPIAMQTITINAYGSMYRVDVYGVWNAYNSAITYQYTVYNSGTASATVSGITIYLYRKTFSQAFADGELIATLKSGLAHTVAANGRYTSAEFSYDVNRSQSYEYYFAARATNATVTYFPVEDYGGLVD